MAPGSRVVTDYLAKSGLLPYLEQLGFGVTAYGCTTCIGNAGDLTQEFNEAIAANDLVCAAVLSGNRNFEARIHPNLKANFLASPPLVVAYAIAGTMLRDLTTEPVGQGKDGPVFLADIWPTSHEIAAVMPFAKDPAIYRMLYGDLANANPLWGTITGATGQVYSWPRSTYIAKPPFFDGFKMATTKTGDIHGARALGIFGDSVTTDHISPAGAIKPTSPAGIYLLEHDVSVVDFNSYGSRRGNHEVMMRGTFANVRIKNLMLPPKEDGTRVEGGVTLFQPGDEKMPIYDAAMKYIAQGTPTVVFGGEEYGTGSSRDWAAKGTQLLGRQGRHREELRAHPPLQPRRNGRAAVPVQGQRQRRLARHHRRGDVRHHRHRSPHRAADGRHADDPPQGRHDRNRCRCCCGSTRRSRSTITATAAFCRSCCASS